MLIIEAPVRAAQIPASHSVSERGTENHSATSGRREPIFPLTGPAGREK